MSHFVTNPINFSVECVREDGQCMVVIDNILFLDDGEESAAIAYLQEKCGHVVIIPDTSVNQIFQESLEAPASLPQHFSEMTVGELHRLCVTIPYDDCKVRVQAFSF
jgi:hypothetical protein